MALVIDIAGLVLGGVAIEQRAVDRGEGFDVGLDFKPGVPLGENLLDGLDRAEAVADDLVDGNLSDVGDALGDERVVRVAGGVGGTGDLRVEREERCLGGIGVILLDRFPKKSADENFVFHAHRVFLEDQVELVIGQLAVVTGAGGDLVVEEAAIGVGIDDAFDGVEAGVVFGDDIAGVEPVER